MSSSQRPVYIPRKRKLATASNTDQTSSKGESYQTKRQFQKQQQPRFHGAFTGGFSAGYFNTVGTKEGWKPSLVKKRDQKLEDFMDDEDHANWGGPTRLRDEYGTKNLPPAGDRDDSAEDKTTSSRTPFLPKSMLEISHQTVGPRLLRRLGWREGGTAIVPENATTSGVNNNGDSNSLEHLARVHLSRRKLRKIQLQSTRVQLPPPKLDKCGLGFEPYKDAPEFQKYRERRKQQAKDRASYNSRVNVYRISDVADSGNEGAPSKNHSRDNPDGDYLTYETAEDFVGKRSAAGFAFRDDEDDAYDDDVAIYKNGNKNRGDPSTLPKGLSVGDEYNTEVYEHESSDEDNYGNSVAALNKNQNKSAVDVGNIFASWAGTNQPSTASGPASVPRAALTSDGKLPLEGFVLGDSMDSNKKRYAGPEMPRDYTIQRHKFGEHENPYVLEAISNAVKLEQKEEKWKQQNTQRQEPIQETSSSRPLSNNFSTLAEAMKRRFTSSTEAFSSNTGEATTEAPKSLPAGLHMPKAIENKEDSTKPVFAEQPKKDIKISRSTKSFLPNPLVCKRFRVPIPNNAKRNAGLVASDEAKSNESVYFEQEILGKATKLQTIEKGPTPNQENANKPENKDEEAPEGIDRPPIENLRKIFEASSDESSSSDDDDESVEESNNDKLEESLTNENSHNAQVGESIQKDKVVRIEEKNNESTSKDENVSLRSSDSEESSSKERRRRRKERHRRKHSRKKHKRKRKDRDHYDSEESSLSDNDDQRRHERRSRDDKKRKKKSSRHKSRKRERSGR